LGQTRKRRKNGPFKWPERRAESGGCLTTLSGYGRIQGEHYEESQVGTARQLNMKMVVRRKKVWVRGKNKNGTRIMK
jgi:hypothetical protein